MNANGVGVRGGTLAGKRLILMGADEREAEERSIVWAALRDRGLGLCTKSSIARLARKERHVNRCNITFDAVVVWEDTGRTGKACFGFPGGGELRR